MDVNLIINQPATASAKINVNNKPETKFYKNFNSENPYSSMNIYILLKDLERNLLQNIKEIGVYDGGLLIGASAVDESKDYLSIIARADDPTTEEKDGYTEGNSITIKVWDGNKEKEYYAEAVKEENKEGKLNFRSLGSIIVKLNSLSSFIDKPNEVTLFDNYPNPFNPSSTFSFYLPKSSQIELIIFNVNGEKIKTLVSGEFSEGIHQIRWDGHNNNGGLVTSGIYFYRLISSESIQVKKLIFLK